MTKALPEARSQPTLHGLLYQANRQATTELRRLAGAEGVPVEFWRLLEVLADERGRTMSTLAGESGLQISATSKLIDRMVEAALVQRSLDPSDQRRVILHISDFGLSKVAALRNDMEQRQRRITRTLSGARERQLRELLQDFIRAHQPGPE